MSRPEDRQYMEQACQLALLGQGHVEPNPMVGCVLVKDGQVVATGYHQQYGGPHAERVALSQLRERSALGLARGATAYVSLEPCAHYGKTPPCTDALIDAGVTRVVCGARDPFSQVSGRGIAQLRDAGIEVELLEPQESAAREVLAPFFKRVTTGLPFVIAKWAMSLDGKMATRIGDSRWISGPASRGHAHCTRGRVDAIIVGSRTAQMDDPLLTARPPGMRTPVRVVVDSAATLALESQLVRTAGQVPVLVWTSGTAPSEKLQQLQSHGCRVGFSSTRDSSLRELLLFLADQVQATNVLVEGGGGLLGQLQDQQLIDEYQVYIAPKIIGGRSATTPCSGLGLASVADGSRLQLCERLALGDDQFLRVRQVHCAQDSADTANPLCE